MVSSNTLRAVATCKYFDYVLCIEYSGSTKNALLYSIYNIAYFPNPQKYGIFQTFVKIFQAKAEDKLICRRSV